MGVVANIPPYDSTENSIKRGGLRPPPQTVAARLVAGNRFFIAYFWRKNASMVIQNKYHHFLVLFLVNGEVIASVKSFSIVFCLYISAYLQFGSFQDSFSTL